MISVQKEPPIDILPENPNDNTGTSNAQTTILSLLINVPTTLVLTQEDNMLIPSTNTKKTGTLLNIIKS